MVPEESDAESVVIEFFDKIWEGLEGYAYVAIKDPQSSDEVSFVQYFFEWPSERESIAAFVLEKSVAYEVYYAPAIFSEQSSQKKYVKGARSFWVEYDGTVPTYPLGIPEPSIKLKSSSDGHEHHYWLLDSIVAPYDLEKVNRSLTYKLGADASGWDAGQILRPPFTKNHKRNKIVRVIKDTGVVYSPGAFKGLPDPPPPVDAPVPTSLRPLEDIVAGVKWPDKVWNLFKVGVPEGKRSEGLMALGYYLAEMKLSNEDMFAILLNADERWGKFKGRKDRYTRLMEIVVRAKNKHPNTLSTTDLVHDLRSLGFETLLKTDIQLEWVWQDLLQKGGYLLLSGPSGVGKTQFSLYTAAQMALGKDFLGKQILAPIKIGFFSLEMGLVDLREFLKTQAIDYTPEEVAVLEQNLRFFPLGEPLYLNRQEEKDRVEQVIQDEGLQGVMIDSLGSMTEDELSREGDVKNLMDWNDQLRQRTGAFTWFIHHHRKATGENKKPNKLADVYGSQYITARATTVLCLWDSGVPMALQVIPLKIRMAPKHDPFLVYRNSKLHFMLKTEISAQPVKPSIHEMEQKLKDKKATPEKQVTPGKDLKGF